MKKLFFFVGITLTITISAQTNKYGFSRIDTVDVVYNAVSLKYPWVGGVNSPQFSTIDLNMDGIDDLFIFDREGNKILTFINNGGPGTDYDYAPEYEPMFPKLQSWALLRDFNNDGKKDIFSYYPGGIMVHKNISTPGNLEFLQITNPFIYSIHPPNNNPINLYTSSVDIPAIDDIDGDGDLDIVTFYFFTSSGEPRIVYHKNFSMEVTGTADTLLFELKNDCWGHFKENFLSNAYLKMNLRDTCSNIYITTPESAPYSGENSKHNTFETITPTEGLRHTSGCVLTFDYNNDGVKDLLFGDSDFKNMVMLTNDGSKGVNMNTSFILQDTVFPSNTIPIYLSTYPCAYYEDIDNDGVKDLIASPNLNFLSENTNSAWYYKNYGTNTAPEFIRIQTNKFQDNMLEFGSGAKPVFVDYNGDGLMDIVIGNIGYFNNTNSSMESKLALLVNVGSANNPAYELISTDFAGLSSLSAGHTYTPTFGDLDGDGDLDMIVGNNTGHLHYYENTAGQGNPAIYVLSQFQIQDNTNTVIFTGQDASPVLFDMDDDGDLDLVVGNRNGRIVYVQNRGNATSPSWEIASTFWGGIDVSEWWTSQGTAAPAIVKNDQNEIQLFVGSESGYIFHYNDIENNLLSGNFNLVDTMVAGINIGPKSKPTLADITGDSKVEMVVGTMRGGMSFYKEDAANVSTIFKPDFKLEAHIFPNPTDNEITISLGTFANYTYFIHDLTGRTLENGKIKGMNHTLNLESYPAGLYFLSFTDGTASVTHKIIKK
ncbi:MAG: T9SS type A sorting domain-containing protein [Flavobacteriales bacterium]